MPDDAPMNDGPKRTSTEPTLVIPRDKLPPRAIRKLVEIDVDPEHPETRALLERAYMSGDRDTLGPCPVCTECKCCKGLALVNARRAAEFEEVLEQFEAVDEKGDDD